jgi:hypothetical protein
MLELVDHFSSYTNPPTMYTGCIHYKQKDSPIFVPDIFWVKIPDNDKWVYYPWEIDLG